MNKFIFVTLMMTLTVFSTPVMANSTGITCGGGVCPPPCTECVGATGIFAPTGPTGTTGLNSLEHKYFYIWEIDLSSLKGQTITEAGISFYGINDWRVEYNDKLYIRLLDGTDITNADNHMSKFVSTDGVFYRGQDGCWGDGDYDDDLKRYGERIGIYVDTGRDPEDETFCITGDALTNLNNYIAGDGIIGIGLDPDCWYRFPNSEAENIKFWYCTTTIPAPGAILLGGIGVTLVGWLRRRRTL